MQTNIEDKIIALFWDHGYSKNQNLTEDQVRKVFNHRSEIEYGNQFKYDMLIQIISECRNSKAQLKPKVIADVVASAYRILKQRLSTLENQNGLINQTKTSLTNIDMKRQKYLKSEQNMEYFERNELNQLDKEYEKTEKQLTELQNNHETFQEEKIIIEKLFIEYEEKKKKQKPTERPQPTPRNLLFIFYLASFGLLVQFFILQLRPCFCALIIYLQALFIILIGYWNRKAVMLMTLTGISSILLDLIGLAVYLVKLFDFKYNFFDETSDPLLHILSYFQKIGFIVSIIVRVVLLISSFILMQPPIRKIHFQICNLKLSLNTRLKIGGN